MSECRWGLQPLQPPLTVPSPNLARKLKDEPLPRLRCLPRLRRHAAPAEPTSALGDSSWTPPQAPKKSPTQLWGWRTLGGRASLPLLVWLNRKASLWPWAHFFSSPVEAEGCLKWAEVVPAPCSPITTLFYRGLSRLCQVSEPGLLCKATPNQDTASVSHGP